ncbi:hypothetical protein RDI58_015620 [Solanum bulbocastanum]|uniref:Uncharacterized protein n=1 Tax=Solanum bulbocastanum TaxID=147425 RepID=A0AAN8THA6_SOLBU
MSSPLSSTLSSSLRSSLPLHRHVSPSPVNSYSIAPICISISNVLCTRHLYLRQKQFPSRHLLRLCSVNTDHNVISSNLSTVLQGKVYESPEFQNSPLDQKGTVEKDETSQTESPTSNTVLTRLRRYGVAGVLSYGLLNTAYYLTTFLIVWFYIAPSPGRMGYLAAVERFLKVMAMVWAGSQVTKIVRAGGALALAPFVDTGLSWFTTKMKFESQGKVSFRSCCRGLLCFGFYAVSHNYITLGVNFLLFICPSGDLPSSSAEGNACSVV